MPSRTRALAAAAAAALLVLTGCSDAGDSENTEATPHGYVEGAQEKADPQVALAYAEDGGRTLHLLDPVTEETDDVQLSVAASSLHEDGRFVYAIDGATVEIVDSGRWTVDHGDHVHFYQAPAKNIGTVTLGSEVTSVAGQGGLVAIGTADGEVRVLNRKDMEADGKISEVGAIETNDDAGFAVPYSDGLLLARDGHIEFTDDTGGAKGARQPCREPGGSALLKNRVAVSCADGIVLFSLDGTAVSGEVLPYAPDHERATAFGNRPRSNAAAAHAAHGAWALDSSAETLSWLPAPGTVAAAFGTGRDDVVLVLDADGTLRSLRAPSGEPIADSAIPGASGAATIVADTSRAYVNAAGTKTIAEIDYADDMRIARTLKTTSTPDLLVEMGR